MLFHTEQTLPPDFLKYTEGQPHKDCLMALPIQPGPFLKPHTYSWGYLCLLKQSLDAYSLAPVGRSQVQRMTCRPKLLLLGETLPS